LLQCLRKTCILQVVASDILKCDIKKHLCVHAANNCRVVCVYHAVNSLTKVLCFELYIQSSQFGHLLVSSGFGVVFQCCLTGFALEKIEKENKR